jgi:hypothetical protein|tara:strand:- start:1611 stop:2048 length:438 start_codon:yes stop_codon:yes gene_type:complete
MERVVQCSHCGDEDRCFEEMQEGYSSFMCFNCGFMSDTRFTEENEAKMERDTSILINKLSWYDQVREIYWFPTVLNMGQKLGMIFPDGDENNWQWKYAKTVEIPEDKKAAMGNHDYMLDVDNAKAYDRMDFLSACKDMGIAKDIK